jgi:hypothetical protein
LVFSNLKICARIQSEWMDSDARIMSLFKFVVTFLYRFLPSQKLKQLKFSVYARANGNRKTAKRFSKFDQLFASFASNTPLGTELQQQRRVLYSKRLTKSKSHQFL